MALLIISKISLEEAERTIQFFKDNPQREDCIVGVGDFHHTHQRSDIPQLEQIVAEAKTAKEVSALTDTVKDANTLAEQYTRPNLTRADRVKIVKAAHEAGMIVKDIAAKCAMSPSTVRRYLKEA